MRRILLITLIALVALSVLLFGTAAWMINNEDFLKAQLGKQVHKFTGRELVVEGPLDIQLGRETTVSAGNITFSNAEWADAAHMVRVGRLEVRVNIPSLFNKQKPAIPWIRVDECSIDLQKNESGESNWDVLPAAENKPEPEPDKQLTLPVELGDLQITNCQLHMDSPGRTRPLQVVAKEITLTRNPDDRVTGAVDGTINDEKVVLSGWLEPVSSFLHGGSMEHQLQVQHGQVTLQSAGTVADAPTMAGAEIKGRFHGPAIEHLLETFALPPLSEGDFDFRLDLDSSGSMTRLDIDGNLGSLDLLASGEVDRLVRPTTGKLEASLKGLNLQALGEALGAEGLLNTPYLLETRADFNGSVINITESKIRAAGDRLQVSGTIDRRQGMPDSDLDIHLESSEIGRWGPIAGQPVSELGALDLAGNVSTNSEGLLRVDAKTDFRQGHFQAQGSVGPVAGPYQPDLSFSFESQDPGPLLRLAGVENFPAEAMHFEGRARYADKQVDISKFALDFAGNRAEVTGTLNVAERFSGSELDVLLDIADVAELGRLFGKQDLPTQSLEVSGTLRPDGIGLAFDIKQSNLGEISLKAKGRIADLEKPLGMDAEFDIELPGLHVLSAVLPDIAWPPGAFKAAGRLVNETQLTRLQDVSLGLGEIRATVAGNLLHDNRFDLHVDMQGPDATVFAPLVGLPLEARPFSLKTGLSGSPSALSLEGILLTLGESRVEGKLEIGLGKPVQVNAALYSPYLDLRNWKKEAEQEKAPGSKTPSSYLFDDTPIFFIADYGVEADASIRVDALDLGNTQLQDIDLGVLLQKNFLEMKPLSVNGMGGGSLTGDIKLDGRQATPVLHYNLHARNLRAGLGSGVGQDTSTWPAGDFDLVMVGTGHTRREVATSLNGKIRVHYGEGLLLLTGLEFLMSDFITELIETLNPFAESNEYTRMECAVMAADIVQGQVSVSPIIFQTDQVTILSQGEIDLVTENIDLSFNTKARKGLGLSAGALINPFIKVGGRLNKPTVELDPKGTVVGGGIAVATAGLSILAKSMTDRFLSSKDPCGDALEEIAERDATPP